MPLRQSDLGALVGLGDIDRCPACGMRRDGTGAAFEDCRDDWHET